MFDFMNLVFFQFGDSAGILVQLKPATTILFDLFDIRSFSTLPLQLPLTVKAALRSEWNDLFLWAGGLGMVDIKHGSIVGLSDPFSDLCKDLPLICKKN